MREIIVTLVSNIELDEEGQFKFDENDEVILKNEDDVGALIKTHPFQVSQIDPETSLLVTGVVFQCEVLWDLHRTPAPALVLPADLYWLSLTDQENQDEVRDDETTDDEGEYEEEEEEGQQN